VRKASITNAMPSRLVAKQSANSAVIVTAMARAVRMRSATSERNGRQAMRLAPEGKRALEDRGPAPSLVADASRLDVGAADIPTEDSILGGGHARPS
jgi:hypothetical protein